MTANKGSARFCHCSVRQFKTNVIYVIRKHSDKLKARMAVAVTAVFFIKSRPLDVYRPRQYAVCVDIGRIGLTYARYKAEVFKIGRSAVNPTHKQRIVADTLVGLHLSFEIALADKEFDILHKFCFCSLRVNVPKVSIAVLSAHKTVDKFDINLLKYLLRRIYGITVLGVCNAFADSYRYPISKYIELYFMSEFNKVFVASNHT